VRSLDDLVTEEEHLDDLVIVVVGGEDEGRDVRGKLALLIRPKERVLLSLLVQLRARHVVGMFDDYLRESIHRVKTMLFQRK